MYKNILIATDGSKFALQAVKHGLKLAKTTGSPVTLVTVTDIWSALEIARQTRDGTQNPITAYEKAATEAADKILAAAKALAVKAGVKCNTLHVKDMHPAEGIMEITAKKGCDLVVMASHGRRGVEKLLLGSIAAEVLTRGKVPVLIVKQ